jgi:hypothetical protein
VRDFSSKQRLHLLCTETQGGHLCITVYGSQATFRSALKNVKKIDKKQAIKKLAFLPPWQTHCGHCCIYMWSVSGCGLRVSTDPATTKYFNHNTKSAIYRG